MEEYLGHLYEETGEPPKLTDEQCKWLVLMGEKGILPPSENEKIVEKPVKENYWRRTNQRKNPL